MTLQNLSTRRTWLAPVTAGLFALAVYTGLVDRAYNALVAPRFAERNQAYLDTSLRRATRLLIPISVIKGSVDVIEGSEMVVEFGDIVQPVLDYVNLAWQVLIIAVLALLAARYFVEGAAVIGPHLLAFSSAAWLCSVFAEWWRLGGASSRCMLRTLTAMCFLLALTVYIALPSSLLAASTMSANSTARLAKQYTETFESLGRVFALSEITRENGIRDKARMIQEKADALVNFVQSEGMEQVSTGVIYLCAAYLLEALVFPLGALLLLLWILKGMLTTLLTTPRMEI